MAGPIRVRPCRLRRNSCVPMSGIRGARAVCSDIAQPRRPRSIPAPIQPSKPAEIAPRIAAEAEEKKPQPCGRTSAASRRTRGIASPRQAPRSRVARGQRGATARAPMAVRVMQRQVRWAHSTAKNGNGNGHSKQNGSHANGANGLHKSKPAAARSLRNGHAANGKPAAKSSARPAHGVARLPDQQ